MGRRVRHLIAKHAGAVLHNDSRFIRNVANNTAISSWTDLTGTSTPTMPSVAAQPIYSASILNGNPAVKFNRPNSYMIGNDSAYPTGAFTYFGVHYCTMSLTTATVALNAARYGVLLEYGSGAFGQSVIPYYGDTNVIGDNGHGFTQNGDGMGWSGKGLKWNISMFKRGSPAVNTYSGSIYPDNQFVTKTMSTNTVKTGTYLIGASTNPNGLKFPGYIASQMLFPTLLSNSLIKRFTTSLGYSFKIATA